MAGKIRRLTRATGEIATIFMLMLGTSCRGEPSTVYVNYVPFGMETYMAVTPETIGNESSCRFRMSDMAALRKILSSATPVGPDAKFGLQRIRAKIVDQSKASLADEVLVDNEGIVSRSNGYSRLTAAALQELKRVIEHACNNM